jgi:hypothetical protein
MPRFAIGDFVEETAGENGIVVGIFTTNDGEPIYGVDSEGSLQFILETRLVPDQSHLEGGGSAGRVSAGTLF